MQIFDSVRWICLVFLVTAVFGSDEETSSPGDSSGNATSGAVAGSDNDQEQTSPDETQTSHDEKRVWTVDDLAGKWKIDFDATWQASKDVFMTDTSLGEGAYPEDQVEKAKIIRTEVFDSIADLQYEFDTANTFKVTIGGETLDGAWEPADPESESLEWVMRVGTGPKSTYRFNFVDEQTLHMTDMYEGFGGGSILVFTRQ